MVSTMLSYGGDEGSIPSGDIKLGAASKVKTIQLGWFLSLYDKVIDAMSLPSKEFLEKSEALWKERHTEYQALYLKWVAEVSKRYRHWRRLVKERPENDAHRKAAYRDYTKAQDTENEFRKLRNEASDNLELRRNQLAKHNKPKSAFAKARQAYLKRPTRALLRLYLIQKARRGNYDERMFDYYKVDSHVNKRCRDAVVRAYAEGLVPTSTRRYPAGAGSYHNARNAKGEGLAIDVGLIETHIGTKYGLDKMRTFQRKEFWRHTKKSGYGDIIELIGPTNNQIILGDRTTTLPEGSALEDQHDDHVHESYRG